MKPLDKFIRYWRVSVALKHRPQIMKNVFDIGCDDGYLLKRLSKTTVRQDGIDPRLPAPLITPTSEIKIGHFPAAISEQHMQDKMDILNVFIS